ncbi:MAG: STAS domain-containing protein [Coriobacteriia bacterium]|nr:STAS domain-containing protein [Coriobacteriia bacterium]
MELEVSTAREQGLCVVSVVGEVDVYTSPTLKQSLIDADDGCSVVVVDMDKVAFIDSSGLGVLVGALRRAREDGGDLRIVCARDNVLKIFRITGLDKVFPMFATLAEAREA